MSVGKAFFRKRRFENDEPLKPAQFAEAMHTSEERGADSLGERTKKSSVAIMAAGQINFTGRLTSQAMALQITGSPNCLRL